MCYNLVQVFVCKSFPHQLNRYHNVYILLQLRGYCTIESEGQVTFSEPKSVIIAIESGDKFDVPEVKKTSFENRIKVLTCV